MWIRSEPRGPSLIMRRIGYPGFLKRAGPRLIIFPFASSLEPLSLRCPNCKYVIAGIVSDRCPECGQQIDRDAWHLPGQRPGIRRLPSLWRVGVYLAFPIPISWIGGIVAVKTVPLIALVVFTGIALGLYLKSAAECARFARTVCRTDQQIMVMIGLWCFLALLSGLATHRLLWMQI